MLITFPAAVYKYHKSEENLSALTTIKTCAMRAAPAVILHCTIPNLTFDLVNHTESIENRSSGWREVHSVQNGNADNFSISKCRFTYEETNFLCQWHMRTADRNSPPGDVRLVFAKQMLPYAGSQILVVRMTGRSLQCLKYDGLFVCLFVTYATRPPIVILKTINII